jgi:hypothetical protein
MSVQYPRKYRGGVSLAQPLVPHIFQDPPRAIFTRKKETVNVGDVLYMVQSDSPNGDPTRINDSIKYYARGQNPMVEVSYSNDGGASRNSSLANTQAHNPYKVEVVRPPLYPIESLVPISAPRIHQNYTVSTNPAITPVNIAGQVDLDVAKHITNTNIGGAGHIRVNPSLEYIRMFEQFEREVKNDKITLQGQILPTRSYSLDLTRDMSQLDPLATRESNVYTVNSSFSNSSYNPTQKPDLASSMSSIKDARHIGIAANPTFNDIIVFDPKTNTSIDVSANVRDKNYVAVNAAAGAPIILNTNDGKEIRIKDYKYSFVSSGLSNPQMVIQIDQPEVTLERNMPLFATTSATSYSTGYNEDMARQTQDSVKLEKLSNFGEYFDRVSRPMDLRSSIPVSAGLSRSPKILI